jgi:hypothetical protein
MVANGPNLPLEISAVKGSLELELKGATKGKN